MTYCVLLSFNVALNKQLIDTFYIKIFPYKPRNFLGFFFIKLLSIFDTKKAIKFQPESLG